MAESKREDLQEEEERRQGGEAAPPVYDDSARRRQSELYQQIAARGPFRYEAGTDPLYRMARDSRVQDGRMAMRDSMGQAAALTGGYGSSYGQAVGQQQYDASLRGLSELMPELYEQAYQMYRDRGEELQTQARQLGEQADRDYARYRDQLEDWRDERAWQQAREDADRERGAEAYARLYALIGATGYTPTEEELSAAGMSPEAADALRREYLRKTGQPGWQVEASSGGGGGGGYSGYSAPQQSQQKLSIDDVLQLGRAARHSNQQLELYRSSAQAIAEGRASFTREELDALWKRHHWYD